MTIKRVVKVKTIAEGQMDAKVSELVSAILLMMVAVSTSSVSWLLSWPFFG